MSYSDSRPLPTGWSAAWDSNYGRFYYITPEGTSTWHDPRAPVSTTTTAPSASTFTSAPSTVISEPTPPPDTQDLPSVPAMRTASPLPIEPTPMYEEKGIAGKPSMTFSDVPLADGRSSYAAPDSYQSGAPILAGAAPVAYSNIYDHANYSYDNGGSMPSQPDPTIQKMFDHDQPRRASAAGLLTHPHDPNSGYYDPNYNAYASPQAAQLRDRSGSIPNTGTYYAPGVGNGPGGIHYSQLPTQDANYGTSSSGYLTDQPYRQSLAQPHNPSTTTPYRPSTAPTRVSSPPPSTRRPSDPTFPPPSSTVNPHKRSQRYCCGCFRTRGGCCAFWWILVLLFLAGAGVAVFFFFPRAPIVVVGQPYVNPGTTGLKTSGDLATASVAKPFIIEFDLRTDVSIFSPNRVNVKVDKLTFVGTLLDAARKKLNARANGQANSVTFKSNANTTFTLPVTLAYSITTPATFIALVPDPVVAVLYQSCLAPGSKPNLRMSYTTQVEIGLISWTGYKPSFDGDLDFPCPVNGATLTSLLSKRGGE